MTAAADMRCPVCAAVDTVRTKYAVARDYISSETFAVLSCGACDVAFTYPQPSDIGRYYPSTYRAYPPAILAALNVFYSRKARRWDRMFDRPGRMLEIGCGPGIMLRAMDSLGWEALGLERSAEAASYGREQFGVNILAGDISELPDECRFDLIVLFQVLEHMSDPAGILAECFRRLSPGGRISVSVPNSASWQAHFGRDKWVHLDIPRHLFHFTPRALDNALTRSGFSDIHFNYVSFEHDPFGWVQTGLNLAISPPNTMLRGLMKLEASKTKFALSLLSAGLLVAPSLLLAGASWIAGRGAIVSATAIRP